MFLNCREIEYIDLTNLNTSNVTDMHAMFSECYKLKEIKGKNKIKIDNNPVHVKHDKTKNLIVVEDTKVVLGLK